MPMIAKDQGHTTTLAEGCLNCRSTDISKEIFSKTTWPISNKFHVELYDNGGTKPWSNGPGHVTKMTAMPKYGNPPPLPPSPPPPPKKKKKKKKKKSLPQNHWASCLET